MRLSVATWNCADGFARKAGWLGEFDADIITIQEVRRAAFDAIADRYVFAHYEPSDTARGVAVFSRRPLTVWRFRKRKADRCYIALRLGDQVDILAAWVKPVEDYARPFQRVLRGFLRHSTASHRIVLGDLNGNVSFDAGRKKGLFRDTLRQFERAGLRSLYHASSGDAHGAEARATHHLTYQAAKPYHLDYIFASENLRCERFELLPEAPWLTERRSDHLPMRAELVLG